VRPRGNPEQALEVTTVGKGTVRGSREAQDRPRARTAGTVLLMNSQHLTHLDDAGDARMVDVAAKDATARTTRATGRVLVSPRVVELLRGEGVPKGDALATARIAGIMGAKKTPELIPLCHPLSVSGVRIGLSVTEDAVEIAATVKTTDRTGVEMEALTAVSVAALTIIDMVKAVDRRAAVSDIRLEEKTGGKSGHWSRS
jgi:cyclic pyranopterin monophosphate synthase